MRRPSSAMAAAFALVAYLAGVAPACARVAAAPRNAATFAPARSGYRFAFPRDHASHPAYQTEWWYYTGHVRAASGRRFGYELTFFRIGLHPGDVPPARGQSRWRGNQLFPAHFALTDERGGAFHHYERFAREALGMGSARTTSLDVRAADWWLRGTVSAHARDREAMRMSAGDSAAGGRDAIDFEQIPDKPPAIHGRDGVSKKAGCATCASHYYSYTRLRTSGTLTYRSERMRVDGISWMDHEFGSGELQSDQAGWDWFSIQLDDRREFMLYVLRKKDGTVTPESSGSVVERDGTVNHLERKAFDVAPTGTWKSPHTGATYPSGWRVRVPSARVDVVLAPTVADQELAAGPNEVSYWEGAVDVRAVGSGTPLGTGYVELTGYAGSVSF